MLAETTARQLLYALILIGVLGFLLARAWLKERGEYQAFKRYQGTGRRQRRMRRWLLESFLVHGGLAVGVLLLSWPYLEPLLAVSQELAPVAWLRTAAAAGLGSLEGWLLYGGLLLLGAVLVLPLLLVRDLQRNELSSLGDVQALLPRNRRELALGAGLSLNAGLVEELLFRLGLPALAFAATGNALAAWLVTVLVFGLLHAYQGITGVITTTLLGTAFALCYTATGSIALVIALHALVNLRSLVLLPMVAFRVHRIAAA